MSIKLSLSRLMISSRRSISSSRGNIMRLAKEQLKLSAEPLGSMKPGSKK